MVIIKWMSFPGNVLHQVGVVKWGLTPSWHRIQLPMVACQSQFQVCSVLCSHCHRCWRCHLSKFRGFLSMFLTGTILTHLNTRIARTCLQSWYCIIVHLPIPHVYNCPTHHNPGLCLVLYNCWRCNELRQSLFCIIATPVLSSITHIQIFQESMQNNIHCKRNAIESWWVMHCNMSMQ